MQSPKKIAIWKKKHRLEKGQLSPKKIAIWKKSHPLEKGQCIVCGCKRTRILYDNPAHRNDSPVWRRLCPEFSLSEDELKLVREKWLGSFCEQHSVYMDAVYWYATGCVRIKINVSELYSSDWITHLKPGWTAMGSSFYSEVFVSEEKIGIRIYRENKQDYQGSLLYDVTALDAVTFSQRAKEGEISFAEAMKNPSLAKNIYLDITPQSFALLPHKIKLKIISELRPRKMLHLTELCIFAAMKNNISLDKLPMNMEEKEKFVKYEISI